MGAVRRLVFDHRIPPLVEMDDGVRSCQIQAGSASLEAEEEDRYVVAVVEFVHMGLAVLRRSVEPFELDVRLLEPFGEEVEHGCELREEEDAVPRVDGFENDLLGEVEFGGRDVVREVAAEILREKDGMAACLAEAQEHGEHVESVLFPAGLAGEIQKAASCEHEIVVDGALLFGEFAEEDLLEFRRQFRADVDLRPAQDERLDLRGDGGLPLFLFRVRRLRPEMEVATPCRSWRWRSSDS